MKDKMKSAKMAVLEDLIGKMRSEEMKSWKSAMKPKEKDVKEEEEKEEERCCEDGTCPECKKKGGLGIIIAVGKPKK